MSFPPLPHAPFMTHEVFKWVKKVKPGGDFWILFLWRRRTTKTCHKRLIQPRKWIIKLHSPSIWHIFHVQWYLQTGSSLSFLFVPPYVHVKPARHILKKIRWEDYDVFVVSVTLRSVLFGWSWKSVSCHTGLDSTVSLHTLSHVLAGGVLFCL